MSHTLSALGTLKSALQALPKTVPLPQQPASARLLTTLGAMDAAPAPPAEAVLEALQARIVTALEQRRPEALRRRDLRDAPWVVWNARMPPRLLAEAVELVVRQSSVSNRTLRNFIEGWLRDFASKPQMIDAGRQIARLLTNTQDRRLERWRDAQKQIKLFDGTAGPANAAARLLQDASSVKNLLAMWTFDEPQRAISGYMRAVQTELLMLAPAAIRGGGGAAAANRVVAFLEIDPKTLRFPDSRGLMARGLLSAWLDRGSEPYDETRAVVLEFLLRHLGDPRLRPTNWAGAGEEVASLVRRWLARASLTTFFELIADHAESQWRWRQAFWAACLEKGAIDDAWVVLGRSAHADARAKKELNGAFARLEGGSAHHSVLLLRVGSLVFAEWSHNGKLRAWPVEWKNAPILGRATYTRAEIVGKGLPFPTIPTYGSTGANDSGLSHIGSERGYWQGSAAELIARRTRIRLTHVDWRVR
jgi:hypothetical protein